MKIINEPTVINWTPVTIRDGEHPNRLVLRKLSADEYAVHRENMKINGNNVEHLDFYSGEYYSDFKSASDAFNRASR